MSMNILMAQSPNRRYADHSNYGTSRADNFRNAPSNGLPLLNTSQVVLNTNPQEALQDYTTQLAILEEQNRARRQVARDTPQQGNSPSPHSPQSAVDPRLWVRREHNTSFERSTSARPADDRVDPIEQYQQMLRIEQQRRIREMEEDRRERQREAEKTQ